MKTRAMSMLAVVCMAGLSQAAGPPAPLAGRLPAGTLVYVGWAGRSLKFDGSMFGQLVNDPAVGKIAGAIRGGILAEIRDEKAKTAFGHAWEMAATAWQHPAAAALIDLRKGPREPMPVAALLVDLGKDRKAFEKRAGALREALKDEAAFTEAKADTEKRESVTYFVHKPRGGPEVAYGFHKDLLLVTLGDGAAKALIELPAGESLATNKKFTACLAAVAGKEMQLGYYVDSPALLERVAALAPPRARPEGAAQAKSIADRVKEVSAAFGLDKISAVAGAMRVDDRGLYTHARIFTPAPHRGLLLPLAGTVVTDADLAGVPDDADLVAAVKVSPAAAHAELRRVLKATEPKAENEFAEGLARLGDELGVSIEKEILPALGDTWVLSSAASQGGFLTGTLLTVQVKDAAKLTAAIKKMEARLAGPGAGEKGQPPPPRPAEGPSIAVLRTKRAEIHYLAVRQRHDFIPVAPAWAVYKNRLYLAAYPQVVQEAVLRNGANVISAEAAFKKARQKITGKPSMLFYANTPRIARTLYPIALIGWTALANMLPGQTGVDAQPAWLPPLSSVEKHLWPQISAVCPDPKGISFEGYGSLPSPALLAGLVLNQAPIGILAPQLQRARTQARAAVEMNQLRMLTMAVMMYHADQAKMPPSLQDAKLAQYLRDRDGRLAKDIAAGKYVYVPPQGNKNKDLPPGRTILLYVPPGTGRPAVLAAFADGHVRQMTWPTFERMLKAQLGG